MKATPSTYHQKVSSLTKTGQVDLFGSQLATRQCYQVNVLPAREEIENARPVKIAWCCEVGFHLEVPSFLLAA